MAEPNNEGLLANPSPTSGEDLESLQPDHIARGVIDHLPAMLAYWDTGLRCRFANHSYQEWFGRTPEQMRAITMPELMGETLFALNAPHIHAAMRGERQSFERTLVKPSGDVGYTWAQYIPDFDDDGVVRGMYALVTDVTALKQTEAQLLQANLLLTEARDRAEAATVAKSEFLANMSHEIRTPLTGIVGFAQLLTKLPDLPDQAAVYADRIATASRMLVTVVNDILDFSKLESGQIELDPQVFDPANFLGETLELVAAQAAAKGLRLDRRIDGPMPAAVRADNARTRQVLMNLIGNALKFTETGGVTVRATYQPEDQSLAFDIVDTGIGIPADRRDRLFQRFSQVDGSTARQYGGTGLGLAICKSLTALMGGDIGLRDQTGPGSAFWFHVKAPVADFADQEPETDVLEDLGHPARILVVDDLAVNRELVRAMLSQVGHKVCESASGAEAIERAEGIAFDLILMDLQMPGMDGMTAARAIRETSAANRATPILALSANVLPKHRAQCREAGMNDHIAKPIDPRELIAKVTNWTSQPLAS